MPEDDSSIHPMDPKIRSQVEVIQEAFDRRGLRVNLLEQDGGVRYMYAEAELLVEEDQLEPVQRLLDQPVGRDPEHVRPVIPGIVLLKLQGRDASLEPEEFDALIGRVDEVFGEGVATPNHVLTVAGSIGPCPASEPEQAYADVEPFPSARADNAGAGIKIYIADTGMLPEGAVSAGLADPAWQRAHPWLARVDGEVDPQAPHPAPAPSNTIPAYAGHGTFAAGVAACMAPGADIWVDDIFHIAGSSLERHFIRKLNRALHKGYDIFHIAATAPTRNDRPMRAFARWLHEARAYKGVVVVAPAGNSASHLPSWPAAFADVVAVGALAKDWRSRALFSNYGPWVDVYAPGRDLINAFATGTYTCKWFPYTGDPRKFYGMAQWSGTSFSTPMVTGLIAARMSRTGENGQEAAAALLAEARAQAIPGVGPILLPY